MTTSIPRRQRPPSSSPRPSAPPEVGSPPSAAFVGVRRIFAAETGNYFLLLGTTLFLVAFGLVMVLSSSSVTSYNENGDFFSVFARQGLFAVIGVPIMLLASRARASFWKRWAGVALLGGIVLQVLVVAPTGLGIEQGGNRNWLDLGPVSIQPSEITKVALVIWLAYILTSRAEGVGDIKRIAVPISVFAGGAVGLVLLGRDLGTGMILVSIVLGAMYFAGVKLRHLALPILAIAIVTPMFLLSGNSRSDRIDVWLNQCSAVGDYSTYCWQTVHGWWALASGGFFGVGLGNSKAKWSWLPEQDNDFIFAIIGEELGLLGALTVLALFVVLAIAFTRIVRANADPFARIAVCGVMVWVIGQAFVNIGVVLGVLPVLGVPLPLMSAGGSALVTTLFAIGIVLSFARHPTSRDDAAEWDAVPARSAR